MPRFTLVTQSLPKVEEFSRLLGWKIDHAHIDLPEVQSLDPAEVAGQKALEAYKMLGNVPVMVEDTGLSVQAWNGLPGALIKWFVTSVGPAGICRMLEPFSSPAAATAQTSVAVCDGEIRVFSGKIDGRIATQPAGQKGFGWDSVFIPEGTNLTYAEMESEEKDRYSMRRIALEKLRAHYGEL
jgi:XTP/dITP diphosphohydrolase